MRGRNAVRLTTALGGKDMADLSCHPGIQEKILLLTCF